jgi:hypothetical protein
VPGRLQRACWDGQDMQVHDSTPTMQTSDDMLVLHAGASCWCFVHKSLIHTYIVCQNSR